MCLEISFYIHFHFVKKVKIIVPLTAKNQYRKLETNISRKELRGHSPNFHIHVSVRDLYIPSFDLPFLLRDIFGLMDEGTLKTPTPLCRFHWSFCLGWWSNLVGSASGQIQSVKFLQNMVYTAQFTPTLPPSDTHCLYKQYI